MPHCGGNKCYVEMTPSPLPDRDVKVAAVACCGKQLTPPLKVFVATAGDRNSASPNICYTTIVLTVWYTQYTLHYHNSYSSEIYITTKIPIVLVHKVVQHFLSSAVSILMSCMPADFTGHHWDPKHSFSGRARYSRLQNGWSMDVG